MAVLIVVMMTL